MSLNERIVCGNFQYRLFAYLHKRDRDRFGLLDAVDYQNARDHLGSCFYIRQIWLTLEEVQEQAFDRDRKWKIVASIFLNPASVDSNEILSE